MGGVEELLDWDQGMGLHHPNFMDVFVPYNAPHHVNFNVNVSLAEQVEDLGLGQINAPKAARMEMEVDKMEELMEDFFWVAWGRSAHSWLTSLQLVIRTKF